MLSDRLNNIQARIAAAINRSGVTRDIRIIAVTKTHPPEVIIEAYNIGIRVIGENRVQEATMKFPKLPKLPGLTRRMIGHLQSNKINKCLELFDTIDSVDSLKLAKKISKKTEALNRNLSVLLEINTSGEATKSGFDPKNIDDLLACTEEPGLTVEGLMTIGPLTRDRSAIQTSFRLLFDLRENLNRQLNTEKKVRELSMGMSSDFEIAIEEGSTMIRLGTALFGERQPYPPPNV